MVENVRMTSGTAPGSTGGPPACPDAELDALHAAALALSGELDPEAVLELIVDHAAGLVAGSFGYLYMVDESEQLLVERIAHGPFVRFVGTTIGRGVGVAGRVWRTGKPHIENHYRNWSDRRMTLGDAVPAAVLGVPLMSSGRVVGVIGLSHMDEGSAFTAADEALVSRFAQLASLAVERSELTAELRSELAERQRTEEELLDTVSRLSGSETALRRTQEEMVRRLSAAAEHRDGAIGQAPRAQRDVRRADPHRKPAPRHRQDRNPRSRTAEAWPARRRRAEPHRAARRDRLPHPHGIRHGAPRPRGVDRAHPP